MFLFSFVLLPPAFLWFSCYELSSAAHSSLVKVLLLIVDS